MAIQDTIQPETPDAGTEASRLTVHNASHVQRSNENETETAFQEENLHLPARELADITLTTFTLLQNMEERRWQERISKYLEAYRMENEQRWQQIQQTVDATLYRIDTHKQEAIGQVDLYFRSKEIALKTEADELLSTIRREQQALDARIAQIEGIVDGKLQELQAIREETLLANRVTGEIARKVEMSAEQILRIQATGKEHARQAEAACDAIQEKLLQTDERITKLDRLERVMDAFHGAVRTIYAGGTQIVEASRPPIVSGPPVIPDTVTNAVVKLLDVPLPPELEAIVQEKEATPEILTPGSSSFDFLRLFIIYTQRDWPEVIQAAREENASYFTRRRLRDLDLILYADFGKMMGDRKDISQDILVYLQQVRARCMEELAATSMRRIVGAPGDVVSPHWLEADPVVHVPTTDPRLDGTFAQMIEGNAGYQMDGKAIQPTRAAFYLLQNSRDLKD